MPTYAHIATYDAPVEQVWSWYDSPGAFRRIMPEWEGIRPLEAGRLVDDATTRFRVSSARFGPCGWRATTVSFQVKCSTT